MSKKKFDDHAPEDRKSIDEVINQTLATMLLAEAELTGLLKVTADDAQRSAMVATILRLRADIDLLMAKYDRILNGKVALAPPTPQMIATAAGFSAQLAEAQASQNRAEAILALSVKALGAASSILSA